MKRTSKFIVCPIGLYDTPDLSLPAKWTLLALDSVCEQGGWVSIGVQGLSTLTNLPSKEVKAALLELREHGAIEVKVNEDNQTLMKPLLYKDAYPKVGDKVVVGDKPTDSDPLEYAVIQDTWNEVCTMLPKIERFTPARKRKTRTALKGAGCSMTELIKAIKTIPHSAFLRGDKGDWCASYDWLVKNSESVTKILEGKYHRDFNEQRAFSAIMQGIDPSEYKSPIDDFYK